MSRELRKPAALPVDALALAVGLLLFAFLALFPISRPVDPALWHQLATGRELWTRGALPSPGRFLHSVSAAPADRGPWLFGALAYPVFRAAGIEGIVLGKAVAVAAAYAVLFASAVGPAAFYPSLLFLLTAYAAGSGRFAFGPEVAACLVFVAMWLALQGPLGPRRAALLVALQAAWTNLDAGAAAGVLLVSCRAVADAIERRGSDPPRSDARRSRLLPLAVAAALFAHPDHYRHALRLLQEFRPSGTFAPSPWILATLACGVLLLAANRRQARPYSVLVFTVFAFLAVADERHALLFALAATPIAIASLEQLLTPTAARRHTLAAAAAATACSGLILTLIINRVTGIGFLVPYPMPAERISLADYSVLWPRRAAHFLADRGLPDRIFNDAGSGSFLAWELSPRRVFIDLLTEDERVLTDYGSLVMQPQQWSRIAERRGIRTVFVRLIPQTDLGGLLRHLLEHPDWLLLFFDGTAAVFARPAPGASPLPLAVDLTAEYYGSVRRSLAFLSRSDLISNTSLWWQIVGYGRRQEQARIYRARAGFYRLASRADLARHALAYAVQLEGRESPATTQERP